MKYLIALDGEFFECDRVQEHQCCSGEDVCLGCRNPLGEYHDDGCDWEECPRCGGQSLACDCEWFESPSLYVDGAKGVIENLKSAIGKIEE
jgi:hypothetical protein